MVMTTLKAPHVFERPKRRFDWITNSALDRPDTEWDVDIEGNDHFAVVPSLGSLVPGWLLIVPRRPLLNLCGLSFQERDALEQLVKQLRDKLTSCFQSAVYDFEHGSQLVGSAMGCGIDQAHLHLVPLSFDLLQAAKECSGDNIAWHNLSQASDLWSNIPLGQEYLTIRNSTGQSVLGFPKYSESQWLRRVIAKNLNRAAEWNYRSHSGLSNIRATLRALHNQNNGKCR